MTLKKVIHKTHLWLGLSSGIIIVFLGITGCILAFEQEIKSLTQTYQYVKKSEQPVLPPSRIKEIALAQLPGKTLHSIAYEGKEKAVQAIFYNIEPEYYYIVYINQYNGEVQKVKNMDADFFRIVVMGHYYLWLPPSIGQPIVATATLIFLVMLISGIVLWWPRNRGARKQRFSVKWNASFKRKNYDLHNVLGFYMTWIAIFLAVTGLVFGFKWFAESLYWTASGGKPLVEFYESVSQKTANVATENTPVIDKIWNKMNKEYPDAEVIEVHVPYNDSVAIEAVANPDANTYWKSDYRYFDQYNMKEINVDHIYGRYKDASVADKMIRMNYDVHTGAVLGLTGKVLAFFASLIAATLPVTGFLIWRGRKKKKKYTTPKMMVQESKNVVLIES